MDTKIYTYSERGLIYSFFFDLYTLNNPDVVKEVIEAMVPIKDGNIPNISDINTCKILIEQSFHDFGKSDAILIIKNRNQKVCLYFEAKCGPKWDIGKERKKLKTDFETKRGGSEWPTVSSNLFVQLLYKQQLADLIYNNSSGYKYFGKMLNKRSRTDKKSPSVPRSIGKKHCILKAVECIKTDPKDTYYISVK